MTRRESTDIPTVTWASSPFDDLKADVILRSSDHVDFRCYKVILSLASTFFEGMFSLPRPQIDGDDPTQDGLHVVEMEEEALTLEVVLRLCHPSSISHPPMIALGDIKSIFDTARKYDMTEVEEIVRRRLVCAPFLAKEPLRVYGIACALRLADEARVAAAATLEFDVATLEELDYCPELEFMSVADLLRLQRYQKRCRIAARAVTQEVRARWGGNRWFDCKVQGPTCKFSTIPGHNPRFINTAATWWLDNYFVPCLRNLEKRPTGRTVVANELVVAALLAAAKQECDNCKTTCLADLERFAFHFGEKIDEAISNVSLWLYSET